ncbi:MAG TPA: branched-chain amino acid ABC transporter permease [Conexibacter sp.]|jgi:branched-chain amino acid transport system permease protein
MSEFLGLCASGIALAAVLTLVALGLVLLYKATNVVSFAQGDLMTAGAYVAFWLTAQEHIAIVPAYLLTLLILFAVGVAMERIAYAPLRRASPIAVVLGTLGVALAIRSALGIWQGTTPKNLSSPVGDGSVNIFGAAVTDQRLLVIGVTAVIVLVLGYVFNSTRYGRQLRALAADREAAQLMGIRVNGLATIAFGASAALAALAGVLVAPLGAIDLNLGFNMMITAFAVAVLAGFGSIGGIVVSAILVGLVQQVLGNYVLQDYSDVLPFGLMLIVIIIRPRGLFTAMQGSRV